MQEFSFSWNEFYKIHQSIRSKAWFFLPPHSDWEPKWAWNSTASFETSSGVWIHVCKHRPACVVVIELGILWRIKLLVLYASGKMSIFYCNTPWNYIRSYKRKSQCSSLSIILSECNSPAGTALRNVPGKRMSANTKMSSNSYKTTIDTTRPDTAPQ